MRKLGVGVVVLLIFSAFAVQGSVLLRLNMPAGATYRYQTKTTTTSSVGTSSGSTQVMQMSVAVKKRMASGFRVQTTVTDVKMTGPGAANSASKIETALKGKSWTADYSPTGKVSNLSTTATGPTKSILTASQAMDAGFMGVLFPAGPVRPGSTWSGELDINKLFKSFPGGNMLKITSGGKFPVRYTLRSIKGNVAYLNFTMNGKTTMSLNTPKNANAQQNPQAQNMDMAISSTGSAQVDTATGLPIASSTTANITMNAMGMHIVQKIVSATKKL